jgi:FkbM family methyltransferase
MPTLLGRIKDWRRRRALALAGVRVEHIAGNVHLVAAGERSGTWWFDPWRLGPQAVVYSFGVGDNLAFDRALADEYGAHVHAFDPTPKSRAWLVRQPLPPRLVVHDVGIAAFDGVQRFAAPAKERDVNFAPGAGALELPVKRFATLARELGHERVDVVKLDIEGGEYEVLPDLLAHGPRFTQLLIEFHHGERGRTLDDTLAALELLRSHGFQLAHVSRRGLEFTFLRRR